MFVERTEGQERVLRAVRTLVQRKGYAAVSLRDIAAEAGYSPAGLYAHYRGRDAILQALADQVRADLSAALAQGRARAEHGRDALVELGLAYIAFAQRRPAEFELLFRWTRSKRTRRDDPRPSPAFDLLREAARAADPDAGDEAIDLACLGVWSVAHGLAALRASHLAEFAGDWEHWNRAVVRAQVNGALGAREGECHG